jgi:hypothetical protein
MIINKPVKQNKMQTAKNIRVNTSCGQPVPLRFYIRPMINAGGKVDRKKIIELFNTDTPTANGVINSPIIIMY